MATAKKSVIVYLNEPDPKKAVIRYYSEDGDEDPAMSSAYISKAALTKIGTPERIKITIEAA